MVVKNRVDIETLDDVGIFFSLFDLQPGTSAAVAVSLIAPGLGVKKECTFCCYWPVGQTSLH